MLMTRFLFMVSTVLLCSLNGAALWQLFSAADPAPSLAAAALAVNAVTWPLALFTAYRIGQATDAEAHRKAKAKAMHHAAHV
jgi:hypothetical protein